MSNKNKEKLIEALEDDELLTFCRILHNSEFSHDDFCSIVESIQENNRDTGNLMTHNENYAEMIRDLSNKSGIMI